ncbi:MAG: FAD:protein FMN transferase [Armatimonadota bacterium]|nr:FAD:protein FMN transferase [Armatimonadota bacterium]
MRILLKAVFLTITLASSSFGGEFKQARWLMGTVAEIDLFADSETKADAAFEAAFAEMAKIDSLMSNWKADSEISIVNREGHIRPVKVSPELMETLEASLKYSRLSRGAFDVTVGPLVRLWGFMGGEKRVPALDEIVRALRSVGYEKVLLDSGSLKVQLAGVGVYVDLGGIAKGYALDRATLTLKRLGIQRALLDLGGNIYALETRPDGKPWEVGVRNPRDESRILTVLRLKNQAVATSGDYEKYFTINGKRYSHIIDPRTGKPAVGCVSATVVAPTAVESDALSTAVFVMGPKKGFALLKTIPGVAGIAVSDKMRVSKCNLE